MLTRSAVTELKPQPRGGTATGDLQQSNPMGQTAGGYDSDTEIQVPGALLMVTDAAYLPVTWESQLKKTLLSFITC